LCSLLGGNALGTNVASLREFPFSQSFHFRSSNLSAQTKAPHSRAQVRPGSFLYFCSTSQALWRKQRIHQRQALQQTQSEQRDVLRQRQFCITCADLRRRGFDASRRRNRRQTCGGMKFRRPQRAHSAKSTRRLCRDTPKEENPARRAN
jgi:hypothetical protein